MLRCLVLLALVVAGLFGPPGTSVAAADLTIGAVSADPGQRLASYAPLAKYLQGKLGVGVKVTVFGTPELLAAALSAKQVDFFFESPFAAAKICQQSQARFLLRQWRGGVAEYTGAVFVRRGSATQLTDLRGKMMVFEDPDSTSSFLLPKLILQRSNLRLTAKNAPDDPVALDEVGYLFVGDERKCLAWVKEKRVFAGGVKSELVAGNPDYQVLAVAPLVPRAVVCVAAHLPETEVSALQTALLGMEHDSRAADALQSLAKTSRFDLFPAGEVSMQRRMVGLIELLGY